MLTHAEIAKLIPHAGAMCLLERVLSWDESNIRCSSRTHRDAANPMRSDGVLPTACGIEYAAQAMAVHGGLAGAIGARPASGYLAALRDVTCREGALDGVEGELVIDAERLMGDEARVIYQFTVTVGTTEMLKGRATVILDAGGA